MANTDLDVVRPVVIRDQVTPDMTVAKTSDIYAFLDRGRIENDLAPEDLRKARRTWQESNDPADQRVADAYRALEEGRQLIDINSAIIRSGRHPNDFPKVAVAPAFVDKITCRVIHDGQIQFMHGRRLLRAPQAYFEVADGHQWPENQSIWKDGVAFVPPMPPAVRKDARKEHLVFFEPNWQQIHVHLPRPVHLDPALLERVAGSLYVVVATWDLSELEAAALR